MIFQTGIVPLIDFIIFKIRWWRFKSFSANSAEV